MDTKSNFLARHLQGQGHLQQHLWGEGQLVVQSWREMTKTDPHKTANNAKGAHTAVTAARVLQQMQTQSI